jgi:hypothetical protein
MSLLALTVWRRGLVRGSCVIRLETRVYWRIFIFSL